MCRLAPWSWLSIALALSLAFAPNLGGAEDPAAPAEAGEAPASESQPVEPLFGGPPVASSDGDEEAEPESAPESDDQDETEAGVAEIGVIDQASFDAPAEDDAETDEEDELEDEAAFAEEVEEEADEADDAATEEVAAPAKKAPPEPLVAQPADAQPSAEKEVETASFNGVRPGVTTIDEVRKNWGEPRQSFEDHGTIHQVYTVEPFKEIDVSYAGKTVAAVVIFMDQSFSAPQLAEQLGLDNLQAVIIPDAKGNWLGQAYPERGVMFGFAPEHAKEKQVAQIVLEPVDALPFLLRAEVRLQRDYAAALKDLDHAVALDSKLARAHGLRAQALLAMMRWDEARKAIDEAIALDEKNLESRLVRAEVLRNLGDYAGASAEARKMIAAAGGKPELVAPALVELARAVAEGPDRDYRRAADYSLEAIKLTETLVKSEQPRTRRAARIVALDAHLELSVAISWGFWRQKEQTVPKWLDRASDLADKLVAEAGAGEEYRLRVAAKALAASVGLKGAIDPTPWVKALQEAGGKQLAATNDPVRRRQLEWQVGLALYDAMQAYHQLEGYREALEVGTLAASALEHVRLERQPLPSDAYLLGRLYFRLGTLHVAQDELHEKAVVWFEKAQPLIELPLPASLQTDIGRQGETLVSMAVSFWSVGQQQKAVELTDAGAKLMERGVEEGVLDADALQVPYNNLATMHRYLGDDKAADKYTELAERSSGTELK